MDYIIVMPAYNEAEHIGATMASIARQSLLPKRLIVVNDGSLDDTAAIVEKFCKKQAWVRLVNHKVKAQHSPGAKIVRAFYAGFGTIETDFDFIVKLDADLELPADYFARVAKIFRENPKVGIAGGINAVFRHGKWVYEDFADKDHVRGAFKAYRKACFRDIDGLKHSLGWDSVDELLARFHGWQVKTDTELHIKHFRKRGKETGAMKVMMKIGFGMYRMRYGFFITMISSIKAGFLNKPYVLTAFAVFRGWLTAWRRGDEFMVSKEEGKYIRQYRRQRMLGKLLRIFK